MSPKCLHRAENDFGGGYLSLEKWNILLRKRVIINLGKYNDLLRKSGMIYLWNDLTWTKFMFPRKDIDHSAVTKHVRMWLKCVRLADGNHQFLYNQNRRSNEINKTFLSYSFLQLFHLILKNQFLVFGCNQTQTL